MNPEIWETLGLAPVRDRDAIRRAYARRLKVTSPEDDPRGFQRLREAYEEALAALDWDWAWKDEDPTQTDAPDAGVVIAQATDVLALLQGDFRVAAPIEPLGPAPSGADDRHERLLGALDQLVAHPGDADPTRFEAALNAVMVSPAMEELMVAVHSGQRIAHLIAHNAPRSDPLVRPAIAAFKWNRDRIGTSHGGAVEAVLNRADDIAFRERVMRGDDLRRTAFRALARPVGQGPAWRDRLAPGFDNAMRELLAEIETRQSLLADLDRETVIAWEQRLSRRRLPVVAFWAAILGPLPPTLMVWGYTNAAWPSIGAYLGGALLCLAAAASYVHGLAPARRWWRETWEWRVPLGARVGWAPASWALLLCAGLLPDHPLVVVAVGVAAAAIGLWAAVTCDFENRAAGTWPLTVQILVTQGLLAIWWILLLATAREATPTPLTVAFAGALVTSAAGITTLPAIFYRWTHRAVRIGLILLLGAAGAGAAWLVLRSRLDPHWAPLAATATAAVVFVHRPVASGLGGNALQWRYRAMAASAFILLSASGQLGWLGASCLWLLIGVAATLISALLLERDL